MKSLRRMSRFLKPYKSKLIIAVLAIFLAAVLTAAAPSVEGLATSQLASDVLDIQKGVTGAHIQFDIIWKIIIVLLAMYILNAISRMTMQYLISDAIQSAVFDLRMSVKEKMTQLPVRYFDEHSAGDLMSRMTTDIEVMSNALQQSFSQVVMSVLSLVFAVIMMFVINWQMALIVSTIIPMTYFASKYIISKSQEMFEIQQASLGNLNSIVQEKFTGFNEIKLYNYQENAIEEFKEANSNLAENGFKANFISGLMSISVTMLTYIVIAVAVFIGAIKVSQGLLLVGSLQAFVRYIWQVNQPLTQLTQLAPTIQSSIAAIDRVFDYLDEENDIEDVDTPVRLEDFQGSVEFKNISFAYTDTPIIKDVSVEINPGEMVAIVGPTGAGKTTIINLLMRFYDVDEGAILVDGIDIRDMRRDDLRSLFGMVLGYLAVKSKIILLMVNQMQVNKISLKLRKEPMYIISLQHYPMHMIWNSMRNPLIFLMEKSN